VTTEDFRTLGARLSNWGRWGADDERGTLNHITPERLVAAAALVRRGVTFSLGIPVDSSGPQLGPRRINPVHLMSQTGDNQVSPGAFRYADDYIFMPLQAGSQWDALSHVFYDDQLYNGFPSRDVNVAGAAHCSIDKIGRDVAGRGVLLDLARLAGRDWLEPGQVLTPADLEAAEAAHGVRVGPGDVLLFRTGWRRLFLERGAREYMAAEPGLGRACCEWLHERQVAAVASDNWAIEVLPGEDPEARMQVHMILIRDMGMTLGEILDLEALADDCAADGRYEFFFCAPPLKVTGGVGSPINPLAIK